MTLTVGTTIAGYEVLDELHRGGMGQVYLARRVAGHGFEKLVALKTVLGSLSGRDEFRAMFENEARLMARLGHPAIAQVHDFVSTEEADFFAMELVAGVSFADIMERHGAVEPAVACRAVATACRGLHAAHELTDENGVSLRVVHRDVSPQNLMLTFDGGVKILDFGIAKTRQSAVTAVGTVKGKPGYMAPEQLAMEALDRRTDIFSIGVVLHELLCGERLFAAASLMALAHQITTGEVPKPSQRAPGIPKELDALVLRCLERQPAKRPASALELAEALDRIAARLNGASLETFVGTTLAEERRAFDMRLQRLRGASDALSPPPSDHGRRPNAETITAGARPRTSDEPSAMAVAAKRPRRGPRYRYTAVAVATLLSAAGVMLLIGEPWLTSRPVAPPSPIAEQPAPVPPPLPDAAPAGDLADRASEPKEASSLNGRRARPSKTRPSQVEAKETPSRGMGFLTVGAEPYALVRLAGQEVGTTPLFDYPVPAGALVVELVTPDKQLVRMRRTVTIAVGEHARITLP